MKTELEQLIHALFTNAELARKASIREKNKVEKQYHHGVCAALLVAAGHMADILKKNAKNANVYRDALINIAKVNGICWDGKRKCEDASSVAHDALKKVDPELYEQIDHLDYRKVQVKRNGQVKIKGIV